MNREHHLKYCTICHNRTMDMKRGLVCSLTGELANFQNECIDYVNDKAEEDRIFHQKMEIAGNEEGGDPLDFQKNKINGQIISLVGTLIFLMSLVSPSVIIIIPAGAVFYGISLYRKGVEQERLQNEK